jgi:putative spermidine/putrescine transport system substrate-binding protein
MRVQKYLGFVLFTLAVSLLLLACGAKEEAPAALTNEQWMKIEEKAKTAVLNIYVEADSAEFIKHFESNTAKELADTYQITANLTKVESIEEPIQKVIKQKEESQLQGEIDILLVAEGDMNKLKEGSALFGPFVGKLPAHGDYFAQNKLNPETAGYGLTVAGLTTKDEYLVIPFNTKQLDAAMVAINQLLVVK